MQPSGVPGTGLDSSAAVNGTAGAVNLQPWDIPSNRPLGPEDSIARTEGSTAQAKLLTSPACCLYSMHWSCTIPAPSQHCAIAVMERRCFEHKERVNIVHSLCLAGRLIGMSGSGHTVFGNAGSGEFCRRSACERARAGPCSRRQALSQKMQCVLMQGPGSSAGAVPASAPAPPPLLVCAGL